jgi:hypothetical protein
MANPPLVWRISSFYILAHFLIRFSLLRACTCRASVRPIALTPAIKLTQLYLKSNGGVYPRHDLGAYHL